MSWQTTYEKWKQFKQLDPELKQQLEEMKDDEVKLEDSFYKELEFGTGGLRGEIGPGSNRLNIYTIRKAAKGLADYIESQGEIAKQKGVAISYDCRFKSPLFAMETAKTLASQGIKAYVFESLRSTPELSYAVRHLNTYSGVMVTASHNPPEYNGFKAYNQFGGQLPPEEAEAVIDYVNQIDNELEIQVEDEATLKEKGLIEMIGETVDRAYQSKLTSVVQNKELIQEMGDDLSIVFTPLHGTGNVPIRQALKQMGFNNVSVVASQEEPDPRFSTVKSPNPEENEAFELAIEQGIKQDADVLIGTDPDADRVGVAALNNQGEYEVLTGNQVGALMLEYLIKAKKANQTLDKGATLIKTIVTSEMGRDIAKANGIDTIDTLTGFKFIGEKIKEFEDQQNRSFLFGYEESYGYLVEDFVRDKDAVQAAMLIAEVAAFYKNKGMTLYQGLQAIYEEYGYYYESLQALTLKGKEGAEKINELLVSFREEPPKEVAEQAVVKIEDYKTSCRLDVKKNVEESIDLPKSNVLKYFLADGSWFCVRPSGTEPKVKFYFAVNGEAEFETKSKLNKLEFDVMKRVREFVNA